MKRGPRQLTICGGGLAGLALGNAMARQGLPVQVLEKGSYPRHRVCGEFICGVRDEVLQELGIAEDLQQAPVLHTMSWWHRDRRILEDELTIPARGLSRHRLDHDLARRFELRGGQLQCQTRCDPEAHQGDGVVWTTGRPQARKSRWIGLKCHLHDMELHSDLEMHLGPGGYVGLSRIEDGKANLCGLFERKPGLRAPMPQLLEHYLECMGAGQLLSRLEQARTNADSCCAVAGFRMGAQDGPDHLLRMGDAQVMIPPFTGNGMSMAFESANLLAHSLLPWLRGDGSWADARRQAQEALAKQFRSRMRLARFLHPHLVHPRLQRLTSLLASADLLPTQWLLRQLRT